MAALVASWQPVVDSQDIRRSSQVIAVSNGDINIFGGEIKPRQPVDNKTYSVSLRDSGSGVRTQQPGSAPSPRVGSASTTLRGKTYIFSGRGGEAMAPVEEQGALHVFDAATGDWRLLAPADPSRPVPPARSYHSMTSDGSSSIYLHAGCPEKGRLADLWTFDVDERTWKQLSSAPGPGMGGTSIAYFDGKLYRMNGFDGKNEQGFALDIYDIKTDAWSKRTWDADSGPQPRSVSALLSLQSGGKDFLLTMFGECDPSSLGHQGAGRMLSDVWAYEIASGKWLQVKIEGKKPQARGWFAADVVDDGDGKKSAVVHGGLAEDNTRLGDVWLLKL